MVFFGICVDARCSFRFSMPSYTTGCPSYRAFYSDTCIPAPLSSQALGAAAAASIRPTLQHALGNRRSEAAVRRAALAGAEEAKLELCSSLLREVAAAFGYDLALALPSEGKHMASQAALCFSGAALLRATGQLQLLPPAVGVGVRVPPGRLHADASTLCVASLSRACFRQYACITPLALAATPRVSTRRRGRAQRRRRHRRRRRRHRRRRAGPAAAAHGAHGAFGGPAGRGQHRGELRGRGRGAAACGSQRPPACAHGAFLLPFCTLVSVAPLLARSEVPSKGQFVKLLSVTACRR